MTIFSRLFILLFLFSLLGCGPTYYSFNEPIEMGPFVFEVSGASEGFDYFNTGERYKIIYVDLLLDTEKSAETKIEFHDFMNGKSKGNRMFIFPAMKIEDTTGAKFDGNVKRASGETRWRVEFLLINFGRGIKSRVDYLDQTASDFNLIIKNPDRRKGQPSVIQFKLS
jgi:hypothetical protein